MQTYERLQKASVSLVAHFPIIEVKYTILRLTWWKKTQTSNPKVNGVLLLSYTNGLNISAKEKNPTQRKMAVFYLLLYWSLVLLFWMTHLVKVAHHVPCNMSHCGREGQRVLYIQVPDLDCSLATTQLTSAGKRAAMDMKGFRRLFLFIFFVVEMLFFMFLSQQSTKNSQVGNTFR